jgi:hypothetical protein
MSMHPCLNVRSCTSTERIILVARKLGKMSPFTTGVKGKLHGIRPLFLPVGADCTRMAVSYAHYAVARQASLRLPDAKQTTPPPLSASKSQNPVQASSINHYVMPGSRLPIPVQRRRRPRRLSSATRSSSSVPPKTAPISVGWDEVISTLPDIQAVKRHSPMSQFLILCSVRCLRKS